MEYQTEDITTTYLTIIHGKVQMMERMVSWSIDDFFQRMTGYHIRIVDL
jgi:hypothetical protein